MHREIPEGVFEKRICGRRRNAWWTVYILDKHIGAVSGAPNAISDGDITVHLPEAGGDGEIAASLRIHVQLSKIVADVLTCERMLIPSYYMHG